MSLNSNKRKGRANANNKLGRSRGSGDKNMAFDGVYSNARFMHAAASLVGCIVQIQVRNGTLYEGIFRTFSHQLDLVLEMTHKVDQKNPPTQGVGPAVSSLLVSFPFEEGITEKLIFRLKDVVMLKASNVDLDYATKDNFTDTAISKYNGQITERELEPWEGPSSDLDSLASSSLECEGGANGWDANDMFRTNAEKYGVKSSYDNTLQEYTVPLERKNTEEYKKQEAKASKIAQEIEANMSYQSRIQLENGDEEDKFSSVVRPENANTSSRYVPPQRRKNTPGPKRVVTTTSSSPVHLSGPKPYPPQQTVSSPAVSTQGYKSLSSPPAPTSSAGKQSLNPPAVSTNQRPVSPGHSPTPTPMPMPTVPKDMVEQTVNGEESEKEEPKSVLALPVADSVPLVPVAVKQATTSPTAPQPLPPRPERTDRRRDGDRKGSKQKGRDDEIEEFKKFSSNFKLSEESKEEKDQIEELQTGNESVPDQSIATPKVSDQHKIVEKQADKELEDDKSASLVKASTLNPNAKEFIFNPNAKAFTPRSMAVTSPHAPTPMHPPRMHTQSPVMAMPHSQMVPGMGQPIFTAMTPQYVMQATPVSMALTSPFAAASLSQAPRFRKVPLTMPPRHDMSQSVHVAAATGQPILAPAAIPTPPQLTMQYTPQGMIHTPGPPQPTMAYPQMYSVVGPRVMPPQHVGMVPTSHAASYCDTSHLQAQLFMSPHPGAAALSAVSATHSMQQGVSGQHSNTPTPQSHTPVLHPSPSPVHQPPPPHVNPSQPPTPTPQVVYHGPMSQHPLQAGHHNPNQSQNHHVTHPHHTNFAGATQQVVLMPQQAVPGPHNHPGSIPSSGPHPLQLHSIHGQNPGSHAGTPTHVLPQMTVIPTSAAMVPAPTAMATSPFVPHPQGCQGYRLRIKNSVPSHNY